MNLTHDEVETLWLEVERGIEQGVRATIENAFSLSNDAKSHLKLGDGYLMLADWIAQTDLADCFIGWATKAHKKAAEINPEALSAFEWYSLGCRLGQARNHKVAADCFKEAVLLEPENWMYHIFLAREYDALGETRRAIESYSLALNNKSIKPDHRKFAEDRLNKLFEQAYSDEGV